jgi:hypothetical protein
MSGFFSSGSDWGIDDNEAALYRSRLAQQLAIEDDARTSARQERLYQLMGEAKQRQDWLIKSSAPSLPRHRERTTAQH